MESSKGISDQVFVPESPTKRLPFINHDSQTNDFHANSNTHYLLQATIPNNQKHNTDASAETSLDGLLKEYMASQNNKGGDGTTGEQINVPHDARPAPLKGNLGVPQDGGKESLQQNIALLKKILHSKKIMKVGVNAMEGIDMATAVTEHRDPNTNNDEVPNQLDLTRDELNHLAQSPDAIKTINEYMSKKKMTKQVQPLTAPHQDPQGSQQTSSSKTDSPSSNTNKTVGSSGREKKLDPKPDDKQHSEQMSSTTTPTTRMPLPTMGTLGLTTVKTNQKDLSKLMDPTAKLGGKVMGNMFYEKFLKPAQDDFEKQATNIEQNSKGKAIGLLGKKVSALQAISDALTLITSKMNPDQAGGKRHHSGRNINYLEVTKGLQDLPDSVEPKDVQFLQDKINKAIETTEAMERQAAYKNPSSVALRLKGKVAEDVQAEARNRVEQRKERLRIDKQIKDIEDSFNMLIEKAEKTGKFSDVDVKNNPTSSLFQELQSGALKMPFNDEQLHGRDTDNSTKGVYGFEVVNQEPVINIINEKDNTVKSNTMDTQSSSATIDVLPQRIPETNKDHEDHKLLAVTHLPNQLKEQSSVITLAPKTASKAVNSIANALRRHSGNQNLSSLALKPITTFNNIQDVTLGGRINSEVIKEKEKEKLYQGKDVNALLNMIKAPSKNTGNQALGSQNQIPGKSASVPGKDLQFPDGNMQKPGKDENAPEVQTVGTLDQNSVKLLSVLVQGFLDQKKNRRILKHHRRKKKKQQLKEEDFVIGAKHDQMGTKKDNGPDRELLDALENQLNSAQRYNHGIKNIVSDPQGTEDEDDDTVKSVPNDKEKEAVEDDSPVLSPTVKPMPAPSDDPSLELVNKYTQKSNLDNLLFSLQKMLKQGNVDIEKDKKKGISSAQESTAENASKTSQLLSKPHVVQFSGAATSGKILNSGDEVKTTDNQDLQKFTQFAGGRILEPASSAGMLPVRQDTISIINANPTTKSKVGAAEINKPTSKLKLKNLVSGVKLLLKALRGKSLASPKGHHWERLEDDTSYQDDKDDNHGDVESNPDEDLLKDRGKTEQDSNYNRFLDYGEAKNKDTGTWYVGEGNSYKTGFQQPKGYQYDEQYEMNLAQQYASTPKEYSTFTPNIYSGPYTSFALQPNTYGYSNKKAFRDPFDKQNTSKLTNPARHALNSVLKNDPIIQAVEEFSNNERQLYNEKLRGIQKDKIPRRKNNH